MRVISHGPFSPFKITLTVPYLLIVMVELPASRQSFWDAGWNSWNLSWLLHTCKFDSKSRIKLFWSWYLVSISMAYAVAVKELGATFWLSTWFPASFFLLSTSSFLIFSIVSLSFSLCFIFLIFTWITESKVQSLG